MAAELRDCTATDPDVRYDQAAALDAVGRLASVTDKLLRLAMLGPEHPQAIAVTYLTLCGVVIGGWLMARAHQLANELIAEDPDFYSSKRQTARFYLQHVLPQSLSLERQIDRGDAIVDADPALF
jgi:hypothetical protein